MHVHYFKKMSFRGKPADQNDTFENEGKPEAVVRTDTKPRGFRTEIMH